MSIMRRLVSSVARRKSKEIEHILSNPVELGEKKLTEIIRRNQNTYYGHLHGFTDIGGPEDYSSRVPTTDSAGMAELLEMVYRNPSGAVMTADPVVWYLMSSGTTGAPKKIPITRLGMKDTKTGSMLGWMAYMNAVEGNDAIVDGTMVTFGAPAVIDHIGGVPVGYASGVYGKHQNKMFQRLIKPGPEVFNLTDMEQKMWEYAKLIASSNTTVIQGIATLGLALIRRMQDMYGPRLLEHFAGTEHESRIRASMSDDRRIDLATLCPNLRMFGSSGIDIGPYRQWLESTVPGLTIWEFYGMSEAGILGIQTEMEPGIKLLPNLNYLEFIPEAEANELQPTVIPLSEVKKNSRYELVVTSMNGWYRYRPGDLLTFTDTNPYTVKQIARKGRVVNLSGEKLSEAHVSNAVKSACARTGSEVMDYTVVGAMDNGIPHYTLAVMIGNRDFSAEGFVRAFEEAVMQTNMEFRIVRETGALGATRLVHMRSSLAEEVVRKSHVQAKPVPLTSDEAVLAACEATS